MRQNRVIEGTGLGLPITKKFVEIMGGTIRVESEYGIGTCFTIEIPQKVLNWKSVQDVPVQTVNTNGELSITFKCPECRVLVVDDNKMNRIVTKKLLEKYDVVIDMVSSGQEAIDKVIQYNYDMIFMDHMMPEMDGIEATEIIRAEYGHRVRGTVFVALTANVLRGAREMYLRSGFQDFLAKPIDKVQLHEILEKWIPDEHKKYS